MTSHAALSAADHLALVPDWQLALRAEGKRPATLKIYVDGITSYLTWCRTHDAAPMDRSCVRLWMNSMLDRGLAPGTTRTRLLAVHRYAAWLLDTDRLDANPLAGIKGPPQRIPLVTPLTDDQLRALLATCTTPTHRPDEPMHHRRDEAIIRLMLETGIRVGETITLALADVDLVAGRITVHHGKGGRPRVIPIGPDATDALVRYLDLRSQHRYADAPNLWLGERGTSFGYDGLGRALRRRAKLAGITGFRPHKLRHTAAHRWLAAGGSETGLMAIGGWTRTDMLVRYTRARASDRAAHEAARLNLGDF